MNNVHVDKYLEVIYIYIINIYYVSQIIFCLNFYFSALVLTNSFKAVILFKKYVKTN